MECEVGKRLVDEIDNAVQSQLDGNDVNTDVAVNAGDTYNSHVRICTACQVNPPQGKYWKPSPKRIDGYAVIFEQVSDDNWGAFVPDLPGLAVGGRSKEEVEKLIKEGIVFHIEGLKEAGLPVPPPQHA